MIFIDSIIKEKIINGINEIINIQEPRWTQVDLDIKLKLIHHYCNFFTNDNQIDLIKIPLKNIRPSKLIDFLNLNSKDLYNKFKKEIQEYTVNFRNNYKKANHFTYNNLPNNEYQNILSNYNAIVYNFIKENSKNTNVDKLYLNLLGSSRNKVISDKKENIKIISIKYNNNFTEIIFDNNIKIKLELYLTSEKITNNISANYKASLYNNF